MSKIFICGAVSDFDDPFAWQEEVAEIEEFQDHVFMNPYELSDDVEDPYDNPADVMEPAVAAVKRCDGLLVRWEDDAFLAGAVVYMKVAFDNDIPVVIWYDGYRDKMQIPISWMMRSFHSDRDTAIRVLLALTGDTEVLTN